MKLKLLLLSLFLFHLGFSQEEQLSGPQLEHVKKIIAVFKQKKTENIPNYIAFPLQREYPLPSVKTSEELKSRFNNIFDEKLISAIANSKVEQWSRVGDKGIMLDDGMVWLDNEKGMITAVNYQSDYEKTLLAEFIDRDKNKLPPSLSEFEAPVYKIRTMKYLIRIDKLADSKFRYASWPLEADESLEPELILTEGKIEHYGNAGNLAFIFTNGNHKYTIFRNVSGQQNRSEITLVVQKGEQIILTQDGRLIMEEL